MTRNHKVNFYCRHAVGICEYNDVSCALIAAITDRHRDQRVVELAGGATKCGSDSPSVSSILPHGMHGKVFSMGF